MALDESTFQTLIPSRFISFTFPNPNPNHRDLRVAVLDSPLEPPASPQIAAMFVPEHRESDWIFLEESGQLQLLFSSPEISRLILIGNQPIDGHESSTIYHRAMKNDDSISQKSLEASLKSLLPVLIPRSCCFHEIPILSYYDNVISAMILEKCVGSFIGEMLVEDVEIESSTGREFRRRLRFKRMPNLIQTEIRITPETDSNLNSSMIIGKVDFQPDLKVLVHSYLIPMVASLSLISSHIEELIKSRVKPKAVCVGVGGGALLTFLRNQLGFAVVGVEADTEVLTVARRYFGLDDDGEFIRVCVGDGVETIEEWSSESSGDNRFDVVMVDLDSGDAVSGMSAPPLKFVEKSVIVGCKRVIRGGGILVMNVISPNRLFYKELVSDLKMMFDELYEIDVGNGENFVVIGASSSSVLDLKSDCQNSSFLLKLRFAISEAYMDSIKKI